jgi:hypothetical protein
LNYFAAVLIKLTSDCDHVVVGFQSTWNDSSFC